MILISKIKEVDKQKRLNKEIESQASPLEKEAIDLIDKYSSLIYDPVRKITLLGRNLPPSAPCPNIIDPSKEPRYSREFLKMKGFLEEHPDYKTFEAKRIREFYRF